MRKDYTLINNNEQRTYMSKLAFLQICSHRFYSIEKYESINDDREFVQKYAQRYKEA